jgi:hypothetical protein
VKGTAFPADYSVVEFELNETKGQTNAAKGPDVQFEGADIIMYVFVKVM